MVLTVFSPVANYIFNAIPRSDRWKISTVVWNDSMEGIDREPLPCESLVTVSENSIVIARQMTGSALPDEP